MTKDQETKKLESELTMAEDITESYATMLLSKNKRIVVHSHISMPSSGTANASWFDSRDAILFIERFYQMCKDYRTLKGYKEDNWEVFSKEIIHEFCDQDITYKIHFQANGRLDEFTKISWFLQELSEKLQNKIIDKTKLNLSDDMLPIDFRKNKKIFKEDEIKQKKMKKLDEQYQLANKLSTVEALKKTASFVKTEEFKSKAKVKNSDSTNIEAAIEKMINKFTNLVLVMRVQSNQIQENSDQYYMLQREESPKPILNYPTNVTVNPTTVQENTQLPVNPYLAQNGSSITDYSSAHEQEEAQTGGILTHPSCFYCGKPGHH
ncbi:conserved hypothetical protein [Coccidioides posadasii str. Silveira]|uniref:Uncharacterized protein n=1 Tax=Coccidioides posadasii (strain RMSCC 757 / Silveira) TaxID=443226 RepID=E9D5E1_COCPS|nr:conserved hypothetical protein [Coccidioides posadasii str. Silveira]